MRFPAGHRRRHCRRARRIGTGVAVEVEYDEPAGMLGLGRAHQSPGRGRGKVRDVLADAGGDRAAGHQDQPARRETLVGEPGLRRGEHPFGGGRDGRRDVRRRRDALRRRNGHRCRDARCGRSAHPDGDGGRHRPIRGKFREDLDSVDR